VLVQGRQASPPSRKLCPNSKKTDTLGKWNRQAGEKALERKPLKGELQEPQCHGKVRFEAPWTLAHSLQEPSAFKSFGTRLSALFLPSTHYDTDSEGEGVGVVKLPERPRFFQRLDPCFEWLDPSPPSQSINGGSGV
jgi:hypothetical protein